MCDDVSKDMQEQEEKLRTFGGRLGAMVVEFSEVLSAEEQEQVLSDLDETTDKAFANAAQKLSSILREFAK